MPSMLAALGAADADRPTLVVKVDARTTSIAILDQEATAALSNSGKPAGRNHHRRAAGGRSLSLGGVFSGHLSPEYRAHLCGWSAGLGRSRSRAAGTDRRRGDGTGEPFAIGYWRRFDSEMENGRGGGSPALLICASISISRVSPTRIARLFWLRWGGGLVALGVLTLLLLIITVNGWIGARKDRQLIRAIRSAECGSGQRASRRGSLVEPARRTAARATAPSSSMISSSASPFPGPRSLKTWNR